MAATKPEVPVSRLLYKLAMKFQRLPHVFGVGQLSGAIRKASCRNRKFKIQDGGSQTGSTCISASMQDSKEIRKATPTFSGSGNSMALSGSLHLGTGSKKFKMAAAKPEVPVS